MAAPRSHVSRPLLLLPSSSSSPLSCVPRQASRAAAAATATAAGVVATTTAATGGEHRPLPRLQFYHRHLRIDAARHFSQSARTRQQTPASTSSSTTRYGTANEPFPPAPPSENRVEGRVEGRAEDRAESRTEPAKGSKKSSSGDGGKTPETKTAETKTPIGDRFTPAEEDVALLSPPGSSTSKSTSKNTTPAESSDGNTQAKQPATDAAAPTSQAQAGDNALTTILSMEPPMSNEANAEDKPPHLQAPPFVHHFDSYTLVKALQGQGGWSEAQAITVMKAMRGLLASNMDLARDGLVSKGDAEMESYLFSAACSELRTEIRQRRATAQNQMTSERTQLQHEVDILGQRIGQDTASLKDELKGMFDDRKMAVQFERRAKENRIQELNYKITIALNSEMRSEVEGLRWVITRRVVIALAAVVAGALALLRFSKTAEAKSAAQRQQLASSSSSRPFTETTDSGTQTVLDREVDLGSPEMMKRLDAGDSPALVSLG